MTDADLIREAWQRCRHDFRADPVHRIPLLPDPQIGPFDQEQVPTAETVDHVTFTCETGHLALRGYPKAWRILGRLRSASVVVAAALY